MPSLRRKGNPFSKKSLSQSDEMGARIESRDIACGTEDPLQKGSCGALAVGPRQMDHPHGAFGITENVQKPGYPGEPRTNTGTRQAENLLLHPVIFLPFFLYQRKTFHSSISTQEEPGSGGKNPPETGSCTLF
jgi:hypothetical protein